MSIGERIKNYFSGPRRKRRVVLTTTVAVVLILLIIFNQSVGDLFRFLAGRAANPADLDWQTIDSVDTERGLSQLADVKIESTHKRYLYLMGGLENSTTLSDKVERLELEWATGAPVASAVWTSGTSWANMYSKRAAFQAFQHDKYLYVVAGDAHLSYYDPTGHPNPLLFSTVERLDVTSDSATWEPVAVLGGVNFYPEIYYDKVAGRLHIVGGVYGYPSEFPTPDFSNDLLKWNEKYSGLLPAVGSNDLLGLKDGGLQDDIQLGGTGTGGAPSLGGGGTVGMQDDGQVHIAQTAPNPNFAKLLSDALKNGEFVTTVSEYYVLGDLSNTTKPSIVYEGELGAKSGGTSGNDYLGEINDTWKIGTSGAGVSRIKHVRILLQEKRSGLTGNPTRTYLVDPAPQGRYGHKLVYQQNRLYAVGGASWSGVIERVFYVNPSSGWIPYTDNLYTFWVIEDDADPLTYVAFDDGNQITPAGLFTAANYQYIGNISYQLQASSLWYGTNADMNGANTLNAKYAFTQGRAFFGLSRMQPVDDEFAYMAVGGLENNSDATLDYKWYSPLNPNGPQIPALRKTVDKTQSDPPVPPLQSPPFADWGISIKVSNQTDYWAGDLGWQEEVVLSEPTFGLTAVGLDNQTIIFGGTGQFMPNPDQPFTNYYVPGSDALPSDKTYLWTMGDSAWVAGGDVKVTGSLHYAALDVRMPLTTISGNEKGEYITLYKVTGEGKVGAEMISALTYGAVGDFDLMHSQIDILPFRDGIPDIIPPAWMNWDVNGDGTLEANVPVVKADRYDYATVTVTLLDYYDQPVTNTSNLLVTLYTDRSPAPAVNKNVWNDGNTVPDWIRIAGTVGADPTGLGPEWQQQFSIIDSVGKATFRIGSAFNNMINETTPDPTELRIRVVEVDGTDLGNGVPGVGMSNLILTSQRVPSLQSQLVATSPVKPDGVDTSLVTATLLDIYSDPVPFKRIIIESNRNVNNVPTIWDTIAPQTANSDITLIPGIATFTATSTHLGFAQMIGYVDNTYDYKNVTNWAPGHPAHIADDPAQTLRQQKLGVRTTYISFSDASSITSLIPDFGYQGQGQVAPWLTMIATGENTQWSSTTTVSFIRPTMSFFAGPKDNREYDLDEVVIYADQFAKELGVEIAPDENVALEILQGNGNFYPCAGGSCKTINTAADSDGLVSFQYLPDPTEKGLLKIRATAQTSGEIGNLWLPILQASSPLEVRMSADPPNVDEVNFQSVIMTEAYANGQLLSGNPVKFDFGKNELAADGTLNKETETNTNGWATVDYTRASLATGQVRVCTTITFNGQTSVGCTTINKTFTAGDPTAKITLNNSADLQINNSAQLTIGGQGINIPTLAEVGSWIFQTLTVINNPSTGQDESWVETYPFTVLPAGYNQGPYLESINNDVPPGTTPPQPPQGFLGSNDNIINIVGANTLFVMGQSVATFTRFDFVTNQPTTESLTATTVSVTDATHMQVSLNIPADATPGYWDVKVVSGDINNGGQIAEKSGHRDFFITTPTGYWVKLRAVPTSIPRDGVATSDITANLYYIDPYDGLMDPIPNIDITFTFENDNGGSLTDELPHQTNSAGQATNKYTTDQGDITVTANIKARADLSSLGITSEVSSIVAIERTAEGGGGGSDPNASESTISAVSPVPIDTNGATAPNPYSTVTVTVRNGSGTPLGNKSVILTSDQATDVIDKTGPQITGIDGKVVYQVSSPNAHTSILTANIESSVQISATVKFVDDPDLILHKFNVTAPFQYRDYDNLVRFWVKDGAWVGAGDTNFTEVYTKTARPGNVLTDLATIPFYLYNTHTYKVAVKGKNHLAVANNSVVPGTPEQVTVSFASANGNKGLLIGDITVASGAIKIPGGFHDNNITNSDVTEVVSNAFRAIDLPDLNYDGMVNVGDVIIVILNFGLGAILP